MEKQFKYHHSVTELGNLQLRIVTEYVKDGKIVSQKYSDAVTPSDIKNMDDWDDKSKSIVKAITEPNVLAEFKNKTQVMIGEGIEEIVSYDRVIDEDGKIAVRKITRIFDEGKEVSKKYHRSWIMPGDDSSNSDVISKALVKELHTKPVIDKYKAKQDKLKM